jgi:D-glycero-D-manno-heptose 1,7-bisphosphate phosphatase
MLQDALKKFHALPVEAVMIGDAARDLEAAAVLGIRRILVRTGKGRNVESNLPSALQPVTVYDDLAAAAEALIAEAKS